MVKAHPLLHHQMRPPQLASRQPTHAAHQLQRGHLPQALADAGVDHVARVPALVAQFALDRRRRQDAADFAEQVDAGGLAEAVVPPHVLVVALHAHVDAELVVVSVHRLRDGLAQVGPAVAAAIGVAPATADAGQVEHAAREDLVLGPAQAAVQPGQAQERLDRRTGCNTTQHQPVELRARGVVIQRLEVGMGNAVDEQVGVIGRQADHRQYFAGARVDRHRRAFLFAEGLDHRPLQVDVDGQAQVGTRLRRHPAHGTDGTALHVGFHLLVADLAAQLALVIALQPGFADVAQRGIALAQLLQVLVIDPAHVADDVRQQVAIRVTASQVGLQLHAGVAPAVHRKTRHFLIGHAQLQRHRDEAAARLARLVEALHVLVAERENPAQAGQRGVHVLDLVRGDIDAERRHVLGQQLAVAVVDQPAPRHHRPWLDAVGLRAGGVFVVLQHLQLEVPAAQHPQPQQYAEKAQQRTATELLHFGLRVLVLAPHVHAFSARACPAAACPAARSTAATAACPAAVPTSNSTAAAARPQTGGCRRR